MKTHLPSLSSSGVTPMTRPQLCSATQDFRFRTGYRSPSFFAPFVSFLLALWFVSSARSETVPALLDDFSDGKCTNLSTERIAITDTVAGGRSSLNQKTEEGVLAVEGELSPARGAPAWANLILPLASTAGESRDLSAYSGVRIRLKRSHGSLVLQVCSKDVQNFDYHNAPIVLPSGDGTEVRIAFSKLKRTWSEQTPLDLKKITSINLLAIGMANGHFAYTVDEIGFY